MSLELKVRIFGDSRLFAIRVYSRVHDILLRVYPRTRTAPMGWAVRLKKGGKDLIEKRKF